LALLVRMIVTLSKCTSLGAFIPKSASGGRYQDCPCDARIRRRTSGSISDSSSTLNPRIPRNVATGYYPYAAENQFPQRNIGSPRATPKMMQAVNSDADVWPRHAAQIASRFHHTTKILLTASPVGTLMTTAVVLVPCCYHEVRTCGFCRKDKVKPGRLLWRRVGSEYLHWIGLALAE
jgi:hypothetical protein